MVIFGVKIGILMKNRKKMENLIVRHVCRYVDDNSTCRDVWKEKTHIFMYNIHIFLFFSNNWRAVVIFDEGAICFEFFFLWQWSNCRPYLICFIVLEHWINIILYKNPICNTYTWNEQGTNQRWENGSNYYSDWSHGWKFQCLKRNLRPCYAL